MSPSRPACVLSDPGGGRFSIRVAARGRSSELPPEGAELVAWGPLKLRPVSRGPSGASGGPACARQLARWRACRGQPSPGAQTGRRKMRPSRCFPNFDRMSRCKPRPVGKRTPSRIWPRSCHYDRDCPPYTCALAAAQEHREHEPARGSKPALPDPSSA